MTVLAQSMSDSMKNRLRISDELLVSGFVAKTDHDSLKLRHPYTISYSKKECGHG